MDFITAFEEHQVERIRRALMTYRHERKAGDVKLTKAILGFLPSYVTYDSTLKNVQRLRKGERIRGAVFLNACVRFLEVEMATPPEEELGLAMRRFVGGMVGYEGMWKELEGDYALRAMTNKGSHTPQVVMSGSARRMGIAVPPIREQANPKGFVVLSISVGEGKEYGTARERYLVSPDEGSSPESGNASFVTLLDRTGVCLPVGSLNLLILIRDFLFSHMYVLTRSPDGLAGTVILPSPDDLLADASAPRESQYNVALQRVPVGA
jgi:hypothetical protein